MVVSSWVDCLSYEYELKAGHITTRTLYGKLGRAKGRSPKHVMKKLGDYRNEVQLDHALVSPV